MSCVEKRHMSHRVGSMLHHRFPNGFSDLFMDETDREVSTLTDRAFRSLCVGDDAVYNDEFLYGYSPFSCHKPLVGEPLKKTHHKEAQKRGQNKIDKNYAKQQANISHMSSFLKALNATEESCKGMLIKNGGMTDSNGESWDKSALRSIQRELSEFSSDYHSNLTDVHYKKHHQHHTADGSSKKTSSDAAIPSGKSSKNKHGKSTVKLRKLNIKNFFLHSEFSPFQTWRDFNQFPFVQEDTTILPTDDIPKWYDLPFYKELTEAHKKETLHTEEVQSCQKAAANPPPPTAPKPIPPPPPPKVLPKPLATSAEKRCSSDGLDGSAAPWRRNRSRAKSVIPLNQPGIPPQENSSKTLDESLWSLKKEARSVEVKAVEEVSSLASTPFSICQLMTPVIPSRQPTETSEILQDVLSPSSLDLPLRPHSEAKVTPEPPLKRDSYKSLASSILFNLKDNRKRVKSRYSPPKFKTALPEDGAQSPLSDHQKFSQAGSEGYASGLSTPAISRDAQTVCSVDLDSNSTPTIGYTKHDPDRPLSDDYLLSNILQPKRGAGEENPISPLIQSKKTKSPKAKKQNYPSLNLYKKSSLDDSDMKYLLAPLSPSAPAHIDQATEANELSPLMLNKELCPKPLPMNIGLSPNTLNVNKDRSPKISPHTLAKDKLSSNVSGGKNAPNVLDKANRPTKDIKEKDFSSTEKDTSSRPMSTMDVIRAAKEAINAAKNKALSAAQSDIINKPISDAEEVRERELDIKVTDSEEMCGSNSSVPESKKDLSQSINEAKSVGSKGNTKKEPPPVPKRNFTKPDIQLSLDKEQTHNADKLVIGDSGDSKLDLPLDDNESTQRQGKHKHIFSARQNNYIKYHRYTGTDDEQREEFEDGDLKVNTEAEVDEETMSLRNMRDNEHIIHDLNALKGLERERSRYGDRVLENARKKLSVFNIEEEARAKNELISRELRNIKRGMLSMRGNTMAKRNLFVQKEKDQSQQETFTKTDSNVLVNKALINDNYDRAKMALEEIISDREKRKNKCTEQEANPIFDVDERNVTKVEQRKKAMKDSKTEVNEEQNDSILTLKEKDLKERLGDLRDHNHIRQILSQSEPRSGESHRLGGRLALPGMAKTEVPCYESEEMTFRHILRQISEESEEKLTNQTDRKKEDTPPVPPRSKKGGSRRDGNGTKETDSLKDVAEEDSRKYENGDICRTGVQQADDPHTRVDSQSESSCVKEKWVKPTRVTDAENSSCLSLELKGNDIFSNSLQADLSPTKEKYQVNHQAPLKPDFLNKTNDTATNNFMTEDEINKANWDINVEAEALGEISIDVISPLLLVNGIRVNQSPPDQASLSSKSSYFSVESALPRNTETESNASHSLENLIVEAEEACEVTRDSSRNTKPDSDRVEYYSLSDHESEPEFVKCPIKSPQKETDVPLKDSKESDSSAAQAVAFDENNQTPISSSNMFSPTLGIPALFKVKDNTFSNKLKLKSVQPWSPRGSVLEREEEVHQVKPNPELLPAHEPATRCSSPIPDEAFKPKESPPNSSLPPPPLSPSNGQTENPKKPQIGGFLTVPQEEDRLSGVSPSSEGVESFTSSMVNTTDEMGMNAGLSKVPSERSGSTCSGHESQTGLPKPPVVLPKSEKAVLKAIKIANRRMKKEEAQRSSQSNSSSSSRHRVDKHKNDTSEAKSNSSRSSKSSERNQREKAKNCRPHGKNSDDQNESRDHNSENNHPDQTDVHHKTMRQSHEPVESNNQNNETLARVVTERQGRSSNRHIRDKPEQRHYSSDRVISTVPVYKAQPNEGPTSNRLLHRSQSIDRYLGGKVERRLSADTSGNLGGKVERRLSADTSEIDKLDLRTQRIEKSIMDEFKQRGRARDKVSRDNPVRRSHSIDAYPNPTPTTLSRQSSHSSQLSRQSSIEHTIVTQSFPMTQRKLLQDPDSGQYFFVDMPVQVKTKTFFDPETGSYVQLPVQPPEGIVPQASPLEVLTPPMVVYHGFVPVPLSPMAQKATIQAPHMEPMLRQMHSTEGRPYLEPVYGQHDNMLGEFLGTEELDCPS